jgi:hypothetical protein
VNLTVYILHLVGGLLLLTIDIVLSYCDHIPFLHKNNISARVLRSQCPPNASPLIKVLVHPCVSFRPVKHCLYSVLREKIMWLYRKYFQAFLTIRNEYLIGHTHWWKHHIFWNTDIHYGHSTRPPQGLCAMHWTNNCNEILTYVTHVTKSGWDQKRHHAVPPWDNLIGCNWTNTYNFHNAMKKRLQTSTTAL